MEETESHRGEHQEMKVSRSSFKRKDRAMRRQGLIMAIIVLVMMTPVPSRAANLVRNPSFEEGFVNDVGLHWQAWSTSGTGYHKQSTRLGRIGAGLYYPNPANPFQAVVSLAPKTVLIMDQMLPAAAPLKGALPDVLIVGRHWVDDRFNTFISAPEAQGTAYADEIFYHYYSAYPTIKIWQGMNEPYPNDADVFRRVARFEKAFAQRLHQHGLKACVLNIAVGNPGNMSYMLFPEVVECLAVADYVGYHAYGGPTNQLMNDPVGGASEEPWFAYRWRQYVNMYKTYGHRMPPVIYTECTTFDGWKGVFTPARIRDDLITFEARTRSDVWSVGMCIFLAGSNGAWDLWEIANEPTIYNDCGEWNRNHPTDAVDGLYSQHFGEVAGGYTGGIVQALNVYPGYLCRLDMSFKLETEGPNTDVRFRAGYDPSGQVSSGAAASIVWSADQIDAQSVETDRWYTHSLTFVPSGSIVSIWVEGAQNPGLQPWKIMVDAVSLAQDGAPPIILPDFDHDGDVDLDDFGRFQLCLTGPGVVQDDPLCLRARLDGDVDVDQSDLNLFLKCMSGPAIPADPRCTLP